MTQPRSDRTATEPQEDVVEREIHIAARPATVFAFFIDPEKMLRWKGVRADLDPRPGGLYRVDIDGQHIVRGAYVEVVPHSRVVFTWGWEGEGVTPPPGGSTVEITLVADGDGTIVRLRHSGLSAEERASHGQGWDHFLPRLAAAAEGHVAADSWRM
jgi:uncharacterized protein YndB with AHSA1/START domain